MKGGFAGKMLFVDLTKGSLKDEELSESIARNYIGGPALGARVLYNMMKPGVDPLGPDNVVGFITGALSGSGAFFSGRYTVVCKSPVTGGFNDGNSGGHFGPELKKAGYDAVFIRGVAKKPVYLWINDGKAEIRSAAKLWGMDVIEAEAALKQELGEPNLRSSLIGPAGEALSLMSCPVTDGHRVPARGGAGAVMGSKKFKGVVVRGTGKVPVADQARLNDVNKRITTALREGPNKPLMDVFKERGSGSFTADHVVAGQGPVKNWGGVGVIDFSEEKANRIAPATLDKYKVRKYFCANCPVGCGADYKVEGGRWPLGDTTRPEYETQGVFGFLCLNDNGEAVMKCNEICNRAGLDTISTGATVAWVIECYENGLLTSKDLDGIEAKWGNAEAIVALTEKIARAEGCGKTLALGSAAAAKKWGKGAEYLQVVRGIEPAMQDPKFAPMLARDYQCDPTPSRHVKGALLANTKLPRYVYTDTGDIDLWCTAYQELNNDAGLCLFIKFTGVPLTTQCDFIEATTGWTFDEKEQLEVGTRSIMMRQAFNVREGLKPADFVLPPRLVGEPPQNEGPLKGVQVDHKLLKRNFFKAIDWDLETGKPSLKSLKSFGMDDVAKDLYGETTKH